MAGQIETTRLKYSYLYSFKWIYSRLKKNEKKQFWLLSLVMAFSALIETMALGSVALFASVITGADVVFSSKGSGVIRNILNFLETPERLMLFSGGLMILMITIKNLIKPIINYVIIRFGTSIEMNFGQILLKGFLKLPYEWHFKHNSAELIQAIEWRHFLGRSFFEPCLNILNSILLIAVLLGALFIVQPFISALVIIVVGGVAYFIYFFIKRQVDRYALEVRNLFQKIHKETSMAIQGIKDVKIHRKEDQFVAKFKKNVLPLSRFLGLLAFYQRSPTPILETVGFWVLCLAIFGMVLLKDMSTAYVTGTITLLAVTAWKVLPAVNMVLASITTARNSLPYISHHIQYITEIETEVRSARVDTKSLNFNDCIRFNNVDFSYQGSNNKALSECHFEIKKGETIGIIGESGAGKSTFVDLLIGLLHPKKGSIMIDGKNLDGTLSDKWLRLIGYVPQSPYIYDGTLAENVAFGNKRDDINRDRVLECCSMASMDDFIHDLPDVIDSFIGERGVRLSGGQQQRVAIARALYNEPKVMIFDEATSSLDSSSEKSIIETIYSFKGKQTLVIIAHRLSTVENCDRVIWLEKGRVKMIGVPKEILGKYENRGRLDQ